MNIPKNLECASYFFVAALVIAWLSGCSTSRKQPTAENTTASAAATPAAQPTAKAAKAKPAPKHATPSAEASSRSSSAAILAQIRQADLKEIAIGEIAEAKAATSEVQAYAKQLVEDHTSVDQQVVAMAQKMKVRLRDSASAGEHRRGSAADQKLNSATGPAFDRMFLQQTSADHDKLIRSLKQEREDASDDDIEALIDKVLPIFEQHKELAQILLKKEQA